MKKRIAFILVFSLLLALSACQNEDKPSKTTEGPTTEEATEPSPTEEATTVPESTTEVPTEPTETLELTEALPEDPCLRMYQDLLNDYKSIVRFRLSDSFDEVWNSTNVLPDISQTLQATLSQMAELKYEWDNMIAQLPAPGIGETAFGYILHDLNADDVPELFWVRNDHSIVAAFTFYDNQVCLLRACWSRFHCYIGQNNTLYCHGSSGAADSFCSSYVLHNGELIETFRFFSEGDYDNVSYYETSVSTKMEISSQRYDDLNTFFPFENSQMWQLMPIYPLTCNITDASAVTSSQEKLLPYLQRVNRADQSIWDGPGYDYRLVGTVELAGTYTITSEVRDYEGNLWGRLKSGAGWIDLSEIAYEASNPPIISANFADKTLLRSGNFHHCIADSSQYMVQIALRCYQTVNDVSFFYNTMAGDYETSEELFYIPQWSPDKPFVADVAFPGDMTSYCISFTDANGIFHLYTISLSGRNGAVVLY